MGTGNGDLIREATMRHVRGHIHAALAAGANPSDLTAEVIETYELNRVEAAMARTIVRNHTVGNQRRGDTPAPATNKPEQT